MKSLVILILTAVMSLFSACTPIETNIENLIIPPKLDETQAEVDAALREIVGDNYVLKYPQNSEEYRSPFNFIDLDGDGTDEAVVFFQTESDTVRMAILNQREEEWKVVTVMSGVPHYTDVDFLDFKKIGSKDSLIVGWKGSGQDLNIMSIYDCYTDIRGAIVLENTTYKEYSKAFFIKNSNDETSIVLLSLGDSYIDESPNIVLLGVDGDEVLRMLDIVDLPENIASFVQMTYGNLTPEEKALFVDVQLNNGNFATVIIGIFEDIFEVPIKLENVIYKTLRTDYIMSEDINRDGIIDIPERVIPAGYKKDSPESFISYKSCNKEGGSYNFEETALYYYNRNKGFGINIPEKLFDKPLSIYAGPDNSEFMFFLNYTGDIYDHSSEIFRVRIRSEKEDEDKLDSKRYTEVGSRGGSIYEISYVPEMLTELGLSHEDIINSFVFLN